MFTHGSPAYAIPILGPATIAIPGSLPATVTASSKKKFRSARVIIGILVLNLIREFLPFSEHGITFILHAPYHFNRTLAVA